MNKKILIFTTAILLTIALIFGCKKESSISNTSNSTGQNIALRTEDTYGRILDSMGIIHNQALEYTFIKIKRWIAS